MADTNPASSPVEPSEDPLGASAEPSAAGPDQATSSGWQAPSTCEGALPPIPIGEDPIELATRTGTRDPQLPSRDSEPSRDGLEQPPATPASAWSLDIAPGLAAETPRDSSPSHCDPSDESADDPNDKHSDAPEEDRVESEAGAAAGGADAPSEPAPTAQDAALTGNPTASADAAPQDSWLSKHIGALTVPACVTDAAGVLTHANPAFVAHTGWTVSVATRWDDLVVDDRRDGLEMERELGLLDPDSGRFPPTCLIGHDGTPVAVEVTETVVDPDTRLIVATPLDVRGIEPATSAADVIVEEASDAVARIDRAGTVVELNRAGRALFGADTTSLETTAALTPESKAVLLTEAASSVATTGRWDGDLEFDLDGESVVFPVSCVAPGDGETILLVRTSLEALQAEPGTDRLTGFGDRMSFVREVTGLFTGEHPHTNAVVVAELDGLSAADREVGVAASDALLVQVAERFKQAVRPDDRWARIDTGTFALLCHDVAGGDSATAVAGRLLDLLSSPFAVGSAAISLTADIGVNVLNGPSDPELALADAHVAAQEARRSAGGHLLLFDPSMRARAERRLDMEGRVGAAIGTDAITVAYQTIFDLERLHPIAVEALARWAPAEDDVVAASEFIDVAISGGFIAELGDQVRADAIRDVARIQTTRSRHSGLLLALNVSTEEVVEHDLVGQIRELCERCSFDPSSLIVEMSEQTLITEHLAATQAIESLRRLGLRVALDDFGSGYSSLSHLARSPVDLLKIDPSITATLIENDEAAAIVDAIVHLARRLKIGVSAEGIETEEQLAELRRAGVRSGQGHYLGRPQPLSELDNSLDT